ncbi:5'-deoxynucleotidase HDDC2-like [Xenia sp. Carnegie-2017]|uniref:5'-deoxynucleotidase HDDC2-like n=1 Tax=Xenia sp. Carnegie-2017 TaxID=2897299 RepID=UPI001F03CBBF|nr:5'-deoxynucleotidase HDDC2-like [Xenia sp. Carnegie-2017]
MAESTQNIMQFMTVVSKLKSLKRTGWVKSGIANPEHVADHMYMMAVMTFFIDEEDLNLSRERCLKLALVHDMAECIVGDITPFCGVSKKEKHAMEQDAMTKISRLAGKVGKELISLWEEYESQSTPEAKFVKNLDRFDMILQAYQYEQESVNVCDLQEFFDSTEGKFDHCLVNTWVTELKKQRVRLRTDQNGIHHDKTNLNLNA